MAQHLYSATTCVYKPIRAQVFVQDPLVATGNLRGVTTIELPGEPFLGPGPTTSRIEVVDENFDTDELYRAVQPLARGGGFAVGRKAPKENYLFHQVNVWAIVTRTLDMLEEDRVLGRRVPWAFDGGRLRIHPHSGVDENAFYDRSTGSLNFQYFEGENGPVYTCLSHDIITHELGHAVLDGLKPLYNELDSPDVAGFHEYFGDALAMVSSLTMIEVVKTVVKNNPSRLSARNLVSDIALEFGSSGRGHKPLRSAANKKTLGQLRNEFEEHDYSEVLTGVFYDVLRAFYEDAVPRTLKRLGKRKRDGQVAVASLISAANRTSRMMLRALDYCPPAGLTYADYARAILRADEVAYPVDDRGYRKLVFGALRSRGILRSWAEARSETPLSNSDLRVYDVDRLAATETDAYVFLDANREALGLPRDVNFDVLRLYRTRKVSAGRYYPPREIVIEFGWSEDVVVRGRGTGALDGEFFPLWCGGTLVFDSDGNVLHYVIKTRTPEREKRFLKYIRYLVEEGAFDGTIELQRDEGRLRVVRNPALRHAKRSR